MNVSKRIYITYFTKKDFDLIREISHNWYRFKRLREKRHYDNEVDETFITVLERECMIETLLGKLGQEDEYLSKKKLSFKK